MAHNKCRVRKIRIPHDALWHHRCVGLSRTGVCEGLSCGERVSCLFEVFVHKILTQEHCFPLKRYSPACTRLLSQYKTMLKLIGDPVSSIEEFMSQYRVHMDQPVLVLVSSAH